MEKRKQTLISLLLFLSVVFLLVLLLEKLQLNHLFFSLVHSLMPFFVALVLVFFIQPLILKCPFPSYKLKTCLIYSGLGFGILLIMGMVGAYLYVERMSFFQLGNELWHKSRVLMERYQLTQYLDFIQTQQMVGNGTEWIVKGMKQVIEGISTFAFSFVIAFFISIEMESMTNEFKKYMKNYEDWFRFYSLFSDVFLKYCFSTLVDTLYIVIVTSILLYGFKTPSFLFLSFALAVLNLFPYVGAIGGTLLILGVHALSGEGNLLLLMVALLVSSQVESNLIHPLIFNKTMKVHPLFLFLAILINDFLFGILGVVLSPILAAFLQMGVKSYMTTLNQSGLGGWEELR